MGHRLSKIYTRTGDEGTTGLGDNTRVAKDNLRVEVYGTLDELNSTIGLILSHKDFSETIEFTLTTIQNHLFDLSSEYCLPGYQAITPEHILFLENHIDQFNSLLTPLKEFILPGGHPAAAFCHLARTICRRAERRAVTLQKTEIINKDGLIYLNRLSDLFFVLARFINHERQIPEPMWQHKRVKK